MNKKGLFEELKIRNKQYPETNLIQYLSPKEYIEVLSLHTARKLSERFQQLAKENRYNEIIQLTEQITELFSEKEEELALPLSMITYSYSYNDLPTMENAFLSRLSLIHNQNHTIKNFFKTLKYELLTADAVDFMVSFIRMSGLQLLIRPLKELEKKGVPVRIITSTYLGITEIKALRKLLEFSNVEVRIVDTQNESFHTKAYLFHRSSELNTVIVGSSNLSQSALKNGHELNVKIPDASFIPVYHQTKKVFDALWNDEEIVCLNDAFLGSYEQLVNAQRQLEKLKINNKIAEANSTYKYKTVISPNKMQKKALMNLKNTRKNGNSKGVIIAATGTGKTYLSAFDVKEFNPKKLLFIAHREELLDNAIETFKQVIQKDYFYGKITGTVKQFEKPYIFSTVQSLQKNETLYRFSREEFDYIVVDEFHHVEAPTYRKVLDYFQPKFLLGLTATPERMDGRDVLALCEHNIVYEIRLRDALNADLLVPFHYFGVSDYTVDYSQIPMKNGFLQEDPLVQALKTNERTDFIIEMINTYGYDGEKMIALGFCTNIEHAEYMSAEFNKRGFNASYLTGEHRIEERKEMIRRLEDEEDPLQIIFTVNIFNEGIDIPKLNLILFLRPTESPTVFIQQLGRGLRKVKGKNFVTILDFIGNYQKSFVVPLALSGQINQKGFDKDSLRIAVSHEFADLPAGSYVDLDPITQKEIIEKIDSIRMNSVDMLKSLYQQFKNELGKSPEIMDFLHTNQSPSFTYFIYKYKTWVQTKEKMKDMNELDEKILNHPLMLEVLERIEGQFPIKWPYEIIILELAFLQKKVTTNDVVTQLQKRFMTTIQNEKHCSLIEHAMCRLSSPYKKQKWSFGVKKGDAFILNDDMLNLTGDAEFFRYLKERLEYGIIEYRRTYQPQRFLTNGEKLTLYQNYTRNDIIFLYQAGVKEGSWREGVHPAGNHYFLFVNLNKADHVEEHLKYKDYFIDQSHFHWQSQNKTSHESKVGQNYIHHKNKGIHIHLFVRKFDKMHGMTLPFMYLGEVDYVSSHGDKPMNINWRLHHPIPEDLFIDLIR
ncbi:DUF3427 domain-containing protein [Fervidibacillus albus]|uniref:DUF3427 domain-containing protein n=1 Tax=Fervidibacillus albus TaxID=2980026 RepID=A0A9E8RU76_9BACI|nr:DUF3427 domain-containing protein [Fervidibacillus albus]WAA08970.1 DUF3427 domain-containing protein [Fervidibacillus albus]